MILIIYHILFVHSQKLFCGKFIYFYYHVLAIYFANNQAFKNIKAIANSTIKKPKPINATGMLLPEPDLVSTFSIFLLLSFTTAFLRLAANSIFWRHIFNHKFFFIFVKPQMDIYISISIRPRISRIKTCLIVRCSSKN